MLYLLNDDNLYRKDIQPRMYIVFRCVKCGRYLYAKIGMRYRVCSRCGFRNDIRRVRVVARVDDERRAGEIVRTLQGSGTDFRPLA